MYLWEEGADPEPSSEPSSLKSITFTSGLPGSTMLKLLWTIATIQKRSLEEDSILILACEEQP